MAAAPSPADATPMRADEPVPSPASRTTLHTVQVQFGDCDPAGIVFFPNFSRWMDAASLSFFMQCGLPPWRELVKTRGIVGTPLLEIHTRFMNAATYGQTLVVATRIESWSNKTFVQHHRITRDDAGAETLVCEGRETRVFVRRDAQDPDRLRAMPVPDDLRALCEQAAAGQADRVPPPDDRQESFRHSRRLP